MKNNAKIIDVNSLIQAGINPKTGLPIRMGLGDSPTKDEIYRQLLILDEQDAVNRYKWYNLPGNISSQELERLLYYRGQLAFFFSPELNEFYFMPYALDGGIDFYGRFKTIHPVPIAAGDTDEEKARIKAQEEILSTIKLDVLYDIPIEDIDVSKHCVLLHDYTKQLSQTIIPRCDLQRGILDVMANCIPYMDTALMLSTGITGVRVTETDVYSNVEGLSKSMHSAALNKRPFIPVSGSVEMQELTPGVVAKGEEFMLAMQSLDNYRLSLYGLDNGGLFQKKSHMLEAEQEVNNINVGLIYQDGLAIRQRFCDIVNSITELGIWCEASECVVNNDMNLDGMIGDEEDQSGEMVGNQPTMEGINE